MLTSRYFALIASPLSAPFSCLALLTHSFPASSLPHFSPSLPLPPLPPLLPPTHQYQLSVLEHFELFYHLLKEHSLSVLRAVAARAKEEEDPMAYITSVQGNGDATRYKWEVWSRSGHLKGTYIQE